MQSALLIGRFQPFHNGHLEVIKDILKTNERVIIVIGSAENSFMPDNPLTAGERFELINESLKEAKIDPKRYCIIPIHNINNYAIWVNHVNSYVPEYTRLYTGSKIVKACYEGKYSKTYRDNKIGPEIVQIKRKMNLSSTKVREAILKNKPWQKMVPPAIASLLTKWGIVRRLASIKDTMIIRKLQ